MYKITEIEYLAYKETKYPKIAEIIQLSLVKICKLNDFVRIG